MLVLFDIDGTILLTRGAGIEAMTHAGRELFGDNFTLEGLDTAGRLDGLIWADAAARNRVDDPDRHHEAFRAAYGRHFRRRVLEAGLVHRLEGVKELVDALRTVDGLTCGLLTGNYPETGQMKIEGAGLAIEHFPVQAWGVDGGHRRELPPVAMSRYEVHHGRPIGAERVVIIGDTPHDVDCARHSGCRSLAVATGKFSEDELAQAGADRVVPTLGSTDDLVGWIMG